MEMNDLLNYDFKIFQLKDAFKFSIDSVLLAEFVNINYRDEKILDLCTGNAPIPLILSTKFTKPIYGVEIQKDIFDLAVKSVKYNNVDNVYLLNKDVKDLLDYFNFKFDIITCNPPYFKCGKESLINKSNIKAIARHEIKITLEDIISISSKLLNFSGSLYLVHRCERLNEIFDLLKKYNFGLRRLQFVYDNFASNSCFLLIEAKYLCKNDLKVMAPIYIDKYLEGIK